MCPIGWTGICDVPILRMLFLMDSWVFWTPGCILAEHNIWCYLLKLPKHSWSLMFHESFNFFNYQTKNVIYVTSLLEESQGYMIQNVVTTIGVHMDQIGGSRVPRNAGYLMFWKILLQERCGHFNSRRCSWRLGFLQVFFPWSLVLPLPQKEPYSRKQ